MINPTIEEQERKNLKLPVNKKAAVLQAILTKYI